MGKGGEITSPLPSRKAVKSLIETDDRTGDVGDSVQRPLPAGIRALVGLHLPVIEELLEVAIDTEG